MTAHAALYWDADASPTGNNTTTGTNLGGAGTWNTASNWFDGSSETTWSPTADAVFTGTAGTVTLGAPQSAASLSFKSNNYTLTGSTLTLSPTTANVNVDANVTATIASTLDTSSTMNKTGAGTLVLTAANTNTATNTGSGTEGGWALNGGTLNINSDLALGAALPDTARNTVTDIVLNQSTIQFAGSFDVEQNRRTKVNTNSSTQNLGDGVFDLLGNTDRWFGSIQGGFGTIRVTASNDNGGMLVLGTDKVASINSFGSSLPAGTVNLTVENHCVVQTSGTVTPTGGELGAETNSNGDPLAIKLQTGGQIRSESGGYSFTRNLILGTGGGSLDTGGWDQTFLGTISGVGSLAKFGTGHLVLDNTSATWTGGTAIHDGILELGRGGSNGLLPATLANPYTISIDAGATFMFNRGSNKTFFDTFTGAGTLVVANSNNAKVRLVSDNSYTGLTTISSGILMIGQGNAGEPGSIVSDVLDNGTLDFNRVENISYGGTISGTGTLVKEAAGQLKLTAANNYSGGTTISAGTLVTANSTGSATGTGSLSVLSGATLAGTGSIGGAVTLNSGAHLSPGSSAGTITLASLALSFGSDLDYELAAAPSGDLTVITTASGLAINGGIVNITALPGFGVGQYPLLDYTTSFTGSIANLSIGAAPPGFIYSFTNNPANTSVDLIVALPEPTSLLFLTAIPLLRRRKRSHRARAGAPIAP